MVLAGSINKAIVADINECGGIAVGICGKDGNLILARKVTEMRDPKTGELLKVDLKQVGEPAKINVMVLEQLRRADVIPVVAPIGFGVDDELTYNINADTSAGAIAGAMRAKRLLFLTDVPGVLDKDGQLISEMTVERARALIAEETAGFMNGQREARLAPTIRALHARAERVRQRELARAAARLSGLDPAQRGAVDAITRGLVNKLLHDPIVRGKALAAGANGEMYAGILRQLYALDEEDGHRAE